MNDNHVPPSYGKNRFNCPFCNAFAHQKWYSIEKNNINELFVLTGIPNARDKDIGTDNELDGLSTLNCVALSTCASCNSYSIWKKGKLINPLVSSAPLAHPDMPNDVKKLYDEAREISSISPMASAALLRLALEKLLPQIGARKAKIDNMIGQLVADGLPKRVEQALDSLRVIGNEAVHPGTIDLNDSREVAFALFKILNYVVDQMITQFKEFDEIYDLIPENKRQGIEARNAKAISRQDP